MLFINTWLMGRSNVHLLPERQYLATPQPVQTPRVRNHAYRRHVWRVPQKLAATTVLPCLHCLSYALVIMVILSAFCSVYYLSRKYPIVATVLLPDTVIGLATHGIIDVTAAAKCVGICVWCLLILCCILLGCTQQYSRADLVDAAVLPAFYLCWIALFWIGDSFMFHEYYQAR